MHDQLYGPSYNWDAYPKQRDGWFTHSWYWYVGWGLLAASVIGLGVWFVQTPPFLDWMSPHGNRGGVIFDAGNAGNANNGDTPPPPATNAGTTLLSLDKETQPDQEGQ